MRVNICAVSLFRSYRIAYKDIFASAPAGATKALKNGYRVGRSWPRIFGYGYPRPRKLESKERLFDFLTCLSWIYLDSRLARNLFFTLSLSIVPRSM